MPKMSFGTGHHATTWLVSRAVLDLGVAGRRGLDMGSGTGVLSIVAAKCGAAHVDAEQDVPAIVACAGELGLRPVATAARDGWMMVHMRKG